MTTVTGMTAARMLAIEAASIVDGDVVVNDLILTKRDGSQINAGNIRGPKGDPGPASALASLLSGASILDIGVANQIRAGRALTPTDFTNMGLSAPTALWNLSDVTDLSGNARNLTNKGAVTFTSGINGLANTAAQFSGSTAQALYITDTGANDPFRFRTVSFGCWMRTAKRGNTVQRLISKMNAANTTVSYGLVIGNVATLDFSTDGGIVAYAQAIGKTDVCDDRWHFIVGTYDGTVIRLYVDSELEAASYLAGFPYSSSAPFNIGGRNADGATAAAEPFFGRIDEVFITSEVLSDEEVRNLYCARVTHALAAVPTIVALNVKRRRRGGSFISSDFPTQPLRLYNFSAGAITDLGSNNRPLTNVGAALTVAGVDGTTGNAFNFNGTSQYMQQNDTALPAALTSRSYGCWFKTSALGAIRGIIGWGTAVTGHAAALIAADGTLVTQSVDDSLIGPWVADGLWHFMVAVEDNAALDGVKRKLYLDGYAAGGSTVMKDIVLAGTNAFKVGVDLSVANFWQGHLDCVFVCGYALTPDQIRSLYAKGTQTLGSSPKSPGDHIEAMSSTDLLVAFDTLESCHQIDLAVA